MGHGEAARVRRNSRFRELASLVSDLAGRPVLRSRPTKATKSGGTILRGNLKKPGPPGPFRSTLLAFLVGGLLLLMLFCGWLYAGTSGAVITTVLGAIALMLVRKVFPQFFLLLSGARSINPEDMPALLA